MPTKESQPVISILPVWLVTTLPTWLVIFIVLYALAALYVAIKFREVRKFLAGAFFVSSGILWYLWLTGTSIPVVMPYLGAISIETRDISGQRAIVHFILFLLCFYFGFISNTNWLHKKIGSVFRSWGACYAGADYYPGRDVPVLAGMGICGRVWWLLRCLHGVSGNPRSGIAETTHPIRHLTRKRTHTESRDSFAFCGVHRSRRSVPA
jgi:hypothetical protein